MKIANASLRMESAHAEASRHAVRESLRAWIGPRRPDFEGGEQPSTLVDVSEAARTSRASETEAIREAALEAEGGPELQLIKSVIEMLTGRRIKVLTAQGFRPVADPTVAPDSRQAPAGGNAGWGVEYERHESFDEVEQTTFAAQGIVRTADGLEIRFDIGLSMSRAWHEESSVSLRAGDVRRKDPLVLNFDGTAAELSSAHFRFDLDADGATEDVPLRAGGSGYLSLDLDGDGKINSGAELFGPQSGDGFADLARYDSDGNRWIDDNDAIFDNLRIWSQAADGNGKLQTLRERSVGALYLGHLATPFELRAGDNESLGAVRSSGVFLTEDGQSGTLQQIDLTV